MKYLVLPLLLFFVACSMKPTKTSSESPILSRKELQQKKLTDKTVILDVRPAFEFNLSHIPGAINVAWEDFSRRTPDYRGLIERDLHPLSRRLALIGIDPQTSVLVVGKGKSGKGEEGRVAWTLESLGVGSVQLALNEAFRQKKGESVQTPNKKAWEAQLNSSLEITWKELKAKIEGSSMPPSKARRKALGNVPLPVKNENFVVIDVRSKEEYSIDNLAKRTPRAFKFENIDWRDFYTDEMDPNPNAIKVLNEMGITQMTEIYLISNHGVRSGAVTWALQRLGYEKARNFAGGYEQVAFKRK